MGSRSVGRRAIFLDRDGVVNRAFLTDGKPYPPTNIEDVTVLPGVEAACAALRKAGFLLILVTNQPDIARGKQSADVVRAINSHLQAKLVLDVVKVCPHDDGDGCDCRKPKPGLLLEAADERGIDLGASFLVGDRWRDIEAGRRAGCLTVWLDQNYNEPRAKLPDFVAKTLAEASRWILQRQQYDQGSNQMSAHTSPTAVQFASEPDPGVVRVEDLAVKVFADGADKAGILELSRDPLIKGFTTNPTLMRMANVTDYEGFARDILSHITDRPISFEVFSDEIDEMYRQARKIAGWGQNVYVKIPITNTRRESTAALIRTLSTEGMKVNVTAIQTVKQVQTAAESLVGSPAAYVSVFAGRIADTGRDPISTMLAALDILAPLPQVELIWASPREVLNVIQANEVGCHIITMTHALLTKLGTIGRNLEDFSLETVRMFHRDGQLAGFSL